MANDGIKIKPGLLVNLTTQIRGGVTRDTKDLPLDVELPEVAEGRRYEALIVKADAEEFKRAEQVRGACTNMIRRLCEATPFGLLCPIQKEAELVQAIKDSYAAAEAFNADSTYSKVYVWALRGYVVGDEDGIKRFTAEMREILQSMDAAIKGCDAMAVRAAVKRAQALGAMLEGEHAAMVTAAVEQARAAANEIAKTIRERGEQAEGFIVAAKTDAIRIAAANFTPLDLDEASVALAGEGLAPVAAVEIDLAPDVAVASVPAVEPEIDDPDPTEDDVDASRAVDEDVAGYRDARDTDSAPALAADSEAFPLA